MSEAQKLHEQAMKVYQDPAAQSTKIVQMQWITLPGMSAYSR